MQYAKHTTIQNHPYTNRDDGIVEEKSIAEQHDINPSRASLIQQIIYTLYGILAALLITRFALALLGANPFNSFANFIYTLSHPFVAPFQSLFGESAIAYKTTRFEFDTLFTILIILQIVYSR